MARLGGMSTESFSSARDRLSAASVGLGSILRDQKAAAAGANRMIVLFGMSSAASRSAVNSPVPSLSSSPLGSNGLLDADDHTELKIDDVWGLDMGIESGSADLLHRQRARHVHELGSRHMSTKSLHHSYDVPHTHSQKHGNFGYDVSHTPKPPRMDMGFDDAHPAQCRLVVDKPLAGLTEVISTNAGAVRRSHLSKLSDCHPKHTHVCQGSTPSRPIPQVNKLHTLHDCNLQAEHQSAPVNVPNWSKNLRKDRPSAINFRSMEQISEDEEEKLPPHEMLAKEHARKERMTSSMCEGQGRTLKGRDMRRVRNAVWRQTGFAD